MLSAQARRSTPPLVMEPPPAPAPPTTTAGRPGLASALLLTLAGTLVVAGFVAAALLVALPMGHRVLDERFELIQLMTLAGWALAFSSLAAAPFIVLRELRVRLALSSFDDVDGEPALLAVERALAVHLLAFITWPASFMLGSLYSFTVFRVHMMATAAVVVTATILALMRIYAWRAERAIARPARVSHCEPAAF